MFLKIRRETETHLRCIKDTLGLDHSSVAEQGLSTQIVLRLGSLHSSKRILYEHAHAGVQTPGI